MKKIFQILCTLFLITACSSGGKSVDLSSTTYWVSSEVTEKGQKASASDIGLDDMSQFMAIMLKADGTGKSVVYGDEEDDTFTWKLDNDKIILTAGKDKIECPFDGSKITFKQEDLEIVLVNSETVPELLKKNPMDSFNINYNTEQSMAMSTFMAGQYYAIENGKIYGQFYSDKKSCLSMKDIKDTGGSVKVSNEVVLDKECMPQYVNIVEGNVYYIRKSLDQTSSVLNKVDSKGNIETIYNSNCDELSVRNNILYFTDENQNFVSTDLNGQNKTVIINKAVYYPYFIDDDWIVYQDDADSEKLHLFNTLASLDIPLSDAKGHAPVINGHYMYFTAGDKHNLNRLDLTTYDEKKNAFTVEKSDKACSYDIFIDEDRILAGVYTDGNIVSKNIKDWKKLEYKDGSTKTYVRYMSKEFEILNDIDSNNVTTGLNAYTYRGTIGNSIN